jgi:hypothetical protein
MTIVASKVQLNSKASKAQTSVIPKDVKIRDTEHQPINPINVP